MWRSAQKIAFELANRNKKSKEATAKQNVGEETSIVIIRKAAGDSWTAEPRL